jgi:hypothetical protein
MNINYNNISNNNNNLKDIYIRYKNVLSGCRTIYDALYFAQYFIKLNPECKNLINGMIHGKQYEKISDLRTIAHILSTLNELKTRNEIDEYINTNIKDNFDYAQINSFIRLGRTKTYDKPNESEKTDEIFKLDISTNNNLNGLLSINIENNLDNNLENNLENIMS